MKKAWLVGALLSTVLGVVAIVAPRASAVTTTTCAWSGTQGTDNKFSTAANWTCSGGLMIPDNTTAVTIDMNLLTDNQSLVNDLPGAIGSFSVTNSSTNTSVYKNVSVDSIGLISGGTITNKSDNGYMGIGSVTSAGNVVMNYASPGTFSFSPSSYDVKGSITVDNGPIEMSSVKNSSPIILEGGATLNILAYYSDLNYANDITINKGFIYVRDHCSKQNTTTGNCEAYVTSKVTLSGTITLNADTQLYIGKKGYASLDISKQIAGSGKLTFSQTSEGDLSIAGVNQPYPTKQTTIKSITDRVNDQGAFITVSRNETATLDNSTITNGYVIVDGVIKGNGKFVHCVYNGTDSYGGYLRVNEGAIIAPGNSPGIITADSFTLDGEYQFQFGGNDPGTGYDQVVVTNYVDTTTTPDRSVVELGPTSKLWTERLGTFSPAKGKVFTIIDNQSKNAVTGTFSGLAEGATFSQNGFVFRISYVGGDGNDVTLTVLSVPTAPNTGFGLIQSSPVVTGVVALFAAAVLIVLGRKLQTSRR